jgi:hypothetical protein
LQKTHFFQPPHRPPVNPPTIHHDSHTTEILLQKRVVLAVAQQEPRNFAQLLTLDPSTLEQLCFERSAMLRTNSNRIGQLAAKQKTNRLICKTVALLIHSENAQRNFDLVAVKRIKRICKCVRFFLKPFCVLNAARHQNLVNLRFKLK